MFNNQVIAGSSGQGGGFYDFPIEQSLRFNNPDQPRLTRSVTHNRKTFTINFWVKRANLGRYWLYGVYSNSADTANLSFESDGTLSFYDFLSGDRFRLNTSRVFRDVGTYYCITLSVDTTQSTASDRVKMFINGVQETSFNTATYPSQNLDLKFGGGGLHAIGTEGTNNRLWWDGYLADWNLIDGQALDPTSFGEFKSGIFIPKDTADLTFGSGGYRLQFGDSAAIGDDTSGNTNDWTVNNLVASDVVPDSVSNNFPTIIKGYNQNVSEGNLKVERNANANNHVGYFSTMGMSSGKWYAEVRYVDAAIDTVTFGVAETNERFSPSDNNTAYAAGSRTGISVNSYVDWATYGVEAKKYSTYNGTNTSYGVAAVSGDIFMLAVDMDNNKFWVGKNGTWMASGNPAAGTNPTHEGAAFAPENPMVFVGSFYTGRVTDIRWNFGQDSTFMAARAAGGNADENGYGDFAYAPPSGFLSLCSANLPTGAIDTLNDETPKDYFNTVLWTGDNTNNRQITGVGFQPSLVAAKSRPAISGFNWADAVRGGTKYLQSNTTNAEGTANIIMSFDSDGFSVGDGNGYDVNKSGEAVVGWSWKANGSGVSNTDGSITSTVSVGATSQQNWVSVASYTGNGTAGATVGHGLDGTVPDMIIVKSRDNARDWRVYHSSLGSAYTLDFNTINAVAGPSTAYWNSTDPTSSVFSIGSVTTVNGSGEDYIAYCFANAENLCRVGKYTGNGSTDGVFVHTGHRPAFLLIKETGNANSWELFDTARDPDNVASQRIFPNSSIAEATTNPSLDILSNGFKARAGNTGINRSGGSYIFLSISEQPFKFANAR